MEANPFIADAIKYAEFCDLCEKLVSKKSNKNQQDSILMDYINSFREKTSSSGPNINKSFFPILRLLLPECDRERGPFGRKEYSLGRTYVKLLGLHKDSQDALKLQCFKSVHGHQGSDFASILYMVLKTRSNNTGDLSIGDINAALDRIANAETGKKTEVLEDELGKLMGATTANEHKWLVRLILKDVKLGMGHKRILSCFHPDAPELFDSCSSLLKVCEELEDVNTRPAEIGVQIFSAVSPMLAERLNIKDIAKLPSNVCYQTEEKFDGERFQVHMKNGEFRYFSRRGHDYTQKYGMNYDSDGILTPLLRNCFGSDVESFILDGEMMGWHKTWKRYGSKGMHYDVKKMTANSAYRPCFCAFDILYYNGKSLAGEDQMKGALKLAARLKILDQLFVDKEGVIVHSKRTLVNEKEDIINALNFAIDKCEEGIVVKAVDSYYVANRRNEGWYKAKPEYTDGAIEDLDLMIIGGFYAENKRTGIVNSFLVAIGEPSETLGGMPKRWLSLGRVATGLSLEERETLSAKLEGHWRDASKHRQPDNQDWGKVKPDFWINPEHSCILQVKASELTRSNNFAAGYALRFPRIIKIRDDKPLKDAMTVTEFDSLIKGRAVEKLPTERFSIDDLLSASTSVTSQSRKRPAKVIHVAEQFRKCANPESVTAESSALSGRKICVLSDELDCSKGELETMILSHGGSVVQNIGRDTWCCIAGRITPRVVNAKAVGKVDIILSKWLRNLPKSNQPAALPSPTRMISMTEKTRVALANVYDAYGDSYREPIDLDELREILTSMDEKNQRQPITTEEMWKLDQELFGGPSPFSFLRLCTLFLPESLERLSIKASFFGASISDLESPLLTHAVIEQRHIDLVISANLRDDVLVVNSNWLIDCIQARTKLKEEDYLIRIKQVPYEM